MTRPLDRLPKAHLHLHLEGAMRPRTLVDLAASAGVPVPETRGYGSFTAFAGLYLAACEVLRTWEDLRRLVREVVEDAAAAGAVWVEPQTYPNRYGDRLGPGAEVADVIVDEGTRTAARLGIGFGLILSGDRSLAPEDAYDLAGVAAERAGRGVVGFGLANDEALWPPAPFRPAFDRAREAGLMSVPHAGELAGPESVRGALDELGAVRLGHGVRAIEDPRLVRELAERGTVLDVCPTSNVMLSVVPSIAEHPLPRLLEAGVRCSLNADDPLLFGPGLLEEYDLVRAELGLDDAALAGIARASIAGSAAPQDLKAGALADVDAWLG